MKISPEVLYVHHVSAGIEDFLRGEGFHVITEMVSQIKEARVPCDVAIGAKRRSDILIFGLQFKRPFRRRRDNVVSWQLTQPQLSNLQKEEIGRWVWYALPWDIDIAKGRRWLWMCHFISPFHIPRNSKALVWDFYRLYSKSDCYQSHHYYVLICAEECRHYNYHLKYEQLLKRSLTKNLCPCVSILGYDSWGTLYQKLLNHMVGIFVPQGEDAEVAIKEALRSAEESKVITEGIIMIIDLVQRIVGIARVAKSEFESEDEYMSPDVSREE